MKVPVKEALRYLGAANADEETRRKALETAKELEERLQPRFVWRLLKIEKGPDGIRLPEAGLTLPGKLAARMLEECGEAALFACTLGAEFDAMLRTEQARDMAKAVILDACGSAFAEAGCDEAEEEIAARRAGLYRTDRFSPGYGDLPLDLQGPLLRALNAEKRLGLQLLDSGLMTPAKSVTAVIGLAETPQAARIRGCAYCNRKAHCAFRERGTTCAV